MAKSFTDAELLTELKEQNPEAMGQIYLAYFKKIEFFVHQILNDDTFSEDITSEVFIKFWERINNGSLKDFEHVCQITSYLYIIARNLTLNWLRKEKKTITLENAETLVSDDDAIARIVFENEAYFKIIEAMKSLSSQNQEVMRLVFEQNKTLKEVADILGTSYTNVTTRKADAINKTKAKLSKWIYLFLAFKAFIALVIYVWKVLAN